MNRSGLLLLLSGALAFAVARAAVEETATRDDPYARGMQALGKRDAEGAVLHLSQVPEDDPRFNQAMVMLGYNLLTRALGRAEEGLPYIEKAYVRAPDDLDVVMPYIWTCTASDRRFPEDAGKRRHASVAKPEFAYLAESLAFEDESPRFSRAVLENDLRYLEVRLTYCYSYLERLGVDYLAALDALRLGLKDETPIRGFLIRLTKFLALFGDAHSTLPYHPVHLLPSGYAPFVAGSYRGRVYALEKEGTDFLDPDHPYLRRIDGVPLDRWLAEAGELVPRGSPQYQWKRKLEALAYSAYLRTELGLPANEQLAIELESEDMKKVRTIRLPLAESPSYLPEPERKESQLLGDIGYLRIPEMDYSPSYLGGLNLFMHRCRGTRGLIIDVRDNGGGTQDTVKIILPYLMPEELSLKVVNVAAYRIPFPLPMPNPSGFLGFGGRGLHPLSSEVWTPEQRVELGAFLKNFRPSWNVPANKFSDWHVMAVQRKANHVAYHYDKPVCVLLNAGSFSATDNFLGALKSHANVTLMGTASGGGSGRMHDYTLPNTGVSVTLCQMASFSRTGQSYDGHGVHPDVVHEAVPEDVMGKSDTLLEMALERLRQTPESN